MEKILVVAALIKKNDRFLIGLRSTGKYKGFWEFPGGKVNIGEELEIALKREIMEEFSIEIDIERFLFRVDHTYLDFVLEMHCFLSTTKSEIMVMNDHSEVMWFDPSENKEINWLPADIKVVELLRSISF